jgi:uncharacterized membrane protein YraQ (UPF0718 family)
MVIMGLFSLFVSKELVVKYLGKTSGIKGILLAIFFGALPNGPLYIAFPLAVALRSKGASISNIVIFLPFRLGLHQNPSGACRASIPGH